MDDPDTVPGGMAAGLVASMRVAAVPFEDGVDMTAFGAVTRVEFRELTTDEFGEYYHVRMERQHAAYIGHRTFVFRGENIGVQCFGVVPEYFDFAQTQKNNADWALEVRDDGCLYGTPVADLTPADREKHRARYQEYLVNAEREKAERVRKQQEADERAKDLFLRMLKPEQRKQYDKGKYVDVTAKSGKVYRIRCDHGCSGNVFWISPEFGKQGDFCFYPNFRNVQQRVPPYDYFLGQMMLIATDETKFLTTAVFSGHHHPDPKLYQRVREGWR